MIKTVKQEVWGHVYTRVIIATSGWRHIFDWATATLQRDTSIPEPHGSWFAVPSPDGIEFYFYLEDEATFFLLSAPINIPVETQ